ncbi:hypothetical protein pSalSNUABM01_076 [Salmonella phage pSal-SNUABM-01]|nr:hypothetical protein pSalSNUABM01_076 [Salmonella phage pSal-SNUABM-01]
MVKFMARQGGLIDFDVNQIIQSIMAAQEAVEMSSFDQALQIAMIVQGKYLHQLTVTPSEVDEEVEDLLMELNPKVARAYITRRVTKLILLDLQKDAEGNK